MKIFSLLKTGSIHPSTDNKVIPAVEFSQLLTANDIIQSAIKDAEEYKEQIHNECEGLKATAKAQGFEEGLEQFNRHLIHFDKLICQLRIDLQKQILPLALTAAKKIVAGQLTLKPDTIVDIVMQALNPVVQNHKFTIFVNKTDKEILDTHKTKIREILEHVQSLTIQERGDISPGGCIIETESGIINATIENQWRALETAFNKYMKE